MIDHDSKHKKNIRLFLCGDVMLGRGIDQILSHPSNLRLHESYITDAREYVYLAENKNGEIAYPVSSDYIWGDALQIWNKLKPTIKIINLETAITQYDNYYSQKEIHYRMHPQNIGVLTSAEINMCALANNHVLDWGDEGLKETLLTLKNAGIQFAGAGETIQQAMSPAIVELTTHNRILLFSAGFAFSGVPSDWQASTKKPGVYYFSDMNDDAIAAIAENIKQYAKTGDLIIFSIHWGSNWGYEIPKSFRYFAHALIDIAKVDVIFGHSSHHPRPIEMYREKPILYGCGDFINDDEGIEGHETYRGDLTFMYFLDFNKTTLQLEKIKLIPMQIKKMRLNLANQEDCQWMLQTLNQTAVDNTKFVLQDHALIYLAK